MTLDDLNHAAVPVYCACMLFVPTLIAWWCHRRRLKGRATGNLTKWDVDRMLASAVLGQMFLVYFLLTFLIWCTQLVNERACFMFCSLVTLLLMPLYCSVAGILLTKWHAAVKYYDEQIEEAPAKPAKSKFEPGPDGLYPVVLP